MTETTAMTPVKATTQEADDSTAAFDAARARLHALAYRLLGSRAEAEDVVQDAWLKWRFASADDVRTPVAWLTTITTRLAIDRLRHRQSERALQADSGLPPWLDDLAPSAETLALRTSELSDAVRLLLERLKPEERAALVLHEAFDCDFAEIGKILDRPPSTCRQIVHRAKHRLQRAGAPLPAADPATHRRLVDALRTAIDAQDSERVLLLVGHVPAMLDEHDHALTVEAFVERISGCTSEALSVEGVRDVALMRDGEIVGLLEVSAGDDGSIAELRIVADAATLHVLNGRFGLRAVQRLLKRIRARTMRPSVTVCGDFPVDIDA
ncbi:sigma-70 family RNA polymerase sigma factor [Paraburkholderia sp.]|uniref:sigma-70 family RNA polymerase sigma factor n=1 Tax=Paraburkholderia sp. TaxID=1926495 RepID=UPI003D6E79A1